MKHRLLTVVLLPSLWLLGATVLAAPVPGGLTISGSVTLDTVTSVDATGGATQTGTFEKVIGGVSTTANFSTVTATSVSGVLTDTLDGFGANLAMSATSDGATMQADRLFVDLMLSLANTSATETYLVSFLASISNAVFAGGINAFAQSMISIFDSSNVEIEFSDYRIDTLNTGSNNNFETDSAPFSFAVTLLPGQTTSFSAELQQRGGVFAEGNFSAALDAFVQLQSIEIRGGNPNPVPLPSTLPLLALGLSLLSLKRRS